MADPRKSAGVIVIREAAEKPLFLLLRAYQYWDCPKGGVEHGEEPLAAAVREVDEETGITDLAFDWGTDFVETAPYAHNKIARYYVARTRIERVTLKINPALGRPEHHEYRWVDFAEAVALTVPRVQHVLAWAANKVIVTATIATTTATPAP